MSGKEICKYCGGPVKVMAYRGTGFCSLDCKKNRPHWWRKNV